MKQKPISAFFAAKPKAKAGSPAAKGKPGAKSASPGADKENAPQPTPHAAPATAADGGAGPGSARKQAAAGSSKASAVLDAPKPPTAKNAPAGGRPAAKKAAVAKGGAKPAAAKAAAKKGSSSSSGGGGGGGGAADDEALVGRCVEVYWPKDGAWYRGTISAVKDGKHHVEYDDGDEEWVQLARERHRLLPAARGPGAAAADARKRQRKSVIVSDDDDDDDCGGDDDAGSDGDDSDFRVGGDDADEDDEVVEELEAEDEEEEAVSDDGDDDVAASPGSRKRKRPSSKAGRKRSSPAKTPGGASGRGAKAAAVPPSSAGATPMDRFGCGARATPPQGFPGFTPPAAGPQHGSTPTGMLFGRPSDAGATPSPLPASTPVTATPDSAAKAALQGALDVTPSAADAGKAEPQLVLGVLASGGAEAARFASRMAERFPFLHPSKIRDKAGRRPDDPGYDPRSLRIPDGWFKAAKVSEAQQQWWGFKAANFDSVLLFKVGKFYEMFEMDAFVGVDVLGLAFMKGEQPHAGFPEAAYHGMAEALARAGYRVLVVEQTETPEQLKARNAARKPGTKAATVVERQAVAVLSRGTLMDPEMISAHPDASYVMAVAEVADGSGHDSPFIGVAALDTAAGQLLLGSWQDDEVRLKLRTQLTGLRPVEVVLPRRNSGAVSAVTSRLVRSGGSRGAAPVLNELLPRSASAEWALQALGRYYPDGAAMPPLLQQLQQQYSEAGTGSEAAQHGAAEAGLAAVGLMVQFLSDAMLDKALLPTLRVEALCDGASGSNEPVAMELNGAALEGLEVLEGALGGPAGSLLGLLDHAATPFGRRRLRRWLARPLYRARDITARQDAVAELMGDASAAVSSARRALAGCSDLERSLARLAASVGRAAAAAGDGDSSSGGGGGGGFGREAAHVVLYEDVARKRVRVLVAAMRDLQALQTALDAFGKLPPQSELLAALAEPSRWSDFQSRLDEMSAAADWGRAEREGVVRPARAGVDAAYDAAKAAVKEVEDELQAYLVRVRGELGCRSVAYTSLNKESHVLEVPEAAAKDVPACYALVGHRKGFKRYSSDELKALLASHAAALEQCERVEAGVLAALEARFVSHQELWASAVEAVGVLDCLMALAGAGLAADGAMCRPQLLEPGPDGAGIFRAVQLRHPAGLATTACGSFVPNDIALGGDAPGFILLTGPNMGGKSTLLRQACLAAVLAQVGALVPAESLALTPMDGVFVRMGARDSILTGQSTFYIEMAETAAMLAKASPRSLVALDELGRGTATLDGAAIAAAVLDHLAHKTRCGGLFATHYHQLAAEHAGDPAVATMHMACAVAEAPAASAGGSGGGADACEMSEVTFLYKLTHGACPKSYGTNVARLAGLPDSVVARASAISSSREAHCAAGAQQQAQVQQQQLQQQGDAMDVDGGGGAGRLEQLAGRLVGQLQQLRAAAAAGDGGDAAPVLEQLAELHMQATVLCH